MTDNYDDHFRNMILISLNDVDMAATPGDCVLTRFGQTNREVFGWDGAKYSEERINIVAQMVYDRYMDTIEGLGTADNIRVFIKDEPHSVAKLETGRYRIISGVSLIDSLVDRILFMRMVVKLQANVQNTGIMIGWSPAGGGYRLMQRLVQNRKTVSIDKSSWDWTVKLWMIKAAKQVIFNLARDAPSWWVAAVDQRFRDLFENPIFSFQDFSKAKQPVAGIMKSGCYLTIFLNSLIQVIMHYMAVIELGDVPNDFFLSMGDDTLQEWYADLGQYVKFIESFGVICKVAVDEHLSFAGYVFKQGIYEPEYKDKHLFKLGYLTEDPEVATSTLMSYQLIYAFDPEGLRFVRNIIRAMNLPEAYISDGDLAALARGFRRF